MVERRSLMIEAAQGISGTQRGQWLLLLDAPLVLLVCALLFAPGVVWALLAYPSPSRVMRLAIGLALGLALQIMLAAPLAATVRITAESIALSTLAALSIATSLGWVMRVRATRLPSRAAGRRREAAWLGAVVVTGVAICAAPLIRWRVPDGWDPSAHSLLSSVIIATGRLPNWRPFEPINSNYPYGAHVLIADASLLSGLAADQVFASLLCVVTPALAMSLVYALARRMWRRGDVAVAAAAAYGLLGYQGSVQYGAWGGLPNALGLVLTLALLEPLLAPGYIRRRVVVGAFLLSATTLTHHLVTLAAALTLGAFFVAITLAWFLCRRQAAARLALQRQLVRIVAVCALGMGFASAVFFPYLIHGVQSLGGTDVFLDLHEYSGWPFDKNGVALWLAATACALLTMGGVWRAFNASAKAASVSARVRHLFARFFAPSAARRAQLYAGTALVTLFTAFIVGQFIFHDIYWALYHHDATAFTPDRFLTDMTYFLALFAAPALIQLWNIGQRCATKALDPLARIALDWAPRVTLGTGALAVALASLVASGQLSAGAGQLPAGDLAAYSWVHAHTPTKTLVIAQTGSAAIWAPYFTRRECYYTPLPVSEDTTGYVNEKRAIIGAQLAALSATPRLRMVALASEGTAWAALVSRPVAVITNRPIPALDVPAFIAHGASVYLIASLVNLDPGNGTLPPMTLTWSRSAQILRTERASLVTGYGIWLPGQVDVAGPSGARWLVTHIVSALAPGAAVMCHGEDGAQLWVDGVVQPHSCTGAITALPTLTEPGPHTISVAIWKSVHAAPWAAVMLLEQASAR
jgi:hypothetical protein